METTTRIVDIARKRPYLKIGSYTPSDGEMADVIKRDWFRQGWVFKDEEAFYTRLDDPCYIPETSDAIHTHNSILAQCGGNEELTEEVFLELDWQHASSLLEDWHVNGEIMECPECGKWFSIFEEGWEWETEVHECPFCKAKIQE